MTTCSLCQHEVGEGDPYSYPYIITAIDGMLHLQCEGILLERVLDPDYIGYPLSHVLDLTRKECQLVGRATRPDLHLVQPDE